MSTVQRRMDALQLTYCTSGGEQVRTSLGRVSVDDLVAAAPVREFRWYKGRTFYSGWYWSSTTCGMVAYESRLELARILMADFDPAVRGIVAQPFQIRERVAGVDRSHVPDLLLWHVDSSVSVVDVKPAHRVSDPKVRAVFDWTAEVVAGRGWAFEVWSGADPVVLENVRFLAGYRRASVVDLRFRDALLELVGGQSTLRGIEHAAESIGPRDLVRPVLLHLLWTGALATDLSRALGPESPVRAADEQTGVEQR